MEEKLDRIIELLEELVKNTTKNTKYGQYDKWNIEQENYLIALHNKGLSTLDIIESIKDKFNIERSPGAITSRLNKLTSISKKKPHYYPREEEDNRPIIDRIYASIGDEPF